MFTFHYISGLFSWKSYKTYLKYCSCSVLSFWKAFVPSFWWVMHSNTWRWWGKCPLWQRSDKASFGVFLGSGSGVAIFELGPPWMLCLWIPHPWPRRGRPHSSLLGISNERCACSESDSISGSLALPAVSHSCIFMVGLSMPMWAQVGYWARQWCLSGAFLSSIACPMILIQEKSHRLGSWGVQKSAKETPWFHVSKNREHKDLKLIA